MIQSAGGGLLRGRVVGQALDHLGQTGVRFQSVGTAVGQQGVKLCVVGASFQTAEKHPVFHAEFGGQDHVFDR